MTASPDRVSVTLASAELRGARLPMVTNRGAYEEANFLVFLPGFAFALLLGDAFDEAPIFNCLVMTQTIQYADTESQDSSPNEEIATR